MSETMTIFHIIAPTHQRIFAITDAYNYTKYTNKIEKPIMISS
jgi:hypothetical protein